MKSEYDFSKAKKGKAAKDIKDLKVVKTIRIDADVLSWLEAESVKQGMGYQTYLNWFLRKSMEANESFEERLKKLEQAVFKKKS
ncbi:MAG: BrnA antitoxin family protein [Bdellovibrionota bacterium]